MNLAGTVVDVARTVTVVDTVRAAPSADAARAAAVGVAVTDGPDSAVPV